MRIYKYRTHWEKSKTPFTLVVTKPHSLILGECHRSLAVPSPDIRGIESEIFAVERARSTFSTICRATQFRNRHGLKFYFLICITRFRNRVTRKSRPLIGLRCLKRLHFVKRRLLEFQIVLVPVDGRDIARSTIVSGRGEVGMEYKSASLRCLDVGAASRRPVLHEFVRSPANRPYIIHRRHELSNSRGPRDSRHKSEPTDYRLSIVWRDIC